MIEMKPTSHLIKASVNNWPAFRIKYRPKAVLTSNGCSINYNQVAAGLGLILNDTATVWQKPGEHINHAPQVQTSLHDASININMNKGNHF